MPRPPMTKSEIRALVADNRQATHVGWLLAADAPVNISKGKRLFEELPESEREIAERYRDHCLDIFVGGHNG